MKEYLTIGIMSISSLAVIMVALKILLTIKKIAKVGIETEGVIIKMDLEQSIDQSSNIRYPVVRFLTDKNIWITKTSNIGVIPGMYKMGKKITVVYQSNAPDNFFIKDNVTYIVPISMIAIGVVLMSIATFQLIHI
jgi:hypothetical protein